MRPNKEILIDYLDHQLNEEDSDQVESMIQNDKAVEGELLFLKLAIDTVRMNSINNKVLEIRNSFQTIAIKLKNQPDLLRNLYKISIRVAAIFILF